MPAEKKAPRKKAAKTAPSPDRKLTAKEERFCLEYLVDLNGSAAARRAGFSARTAANTAYQLMRAPRIKARIDALKAERAKRVEFTADDAIKRMIAVVTADARKLTSHLIGPCRYCWGIDHRYQWKTEREWEDARAEAEDKGKKRLPTCEGGFGYRLSGEPNPDCPECSGLGHPYTRFADTSKLTGDEALLFEGVKQGRDGLQFLMPDRGRMFDRLADHLGIRNREAENSAAAAFQDMLGQLLGGAASKAPIAQTSSDDDGDA